MINQRTMKQKVNATAKEFGIKGVLKEIRV